MQIGIFTVGDVTTDPTTGRTPTEHERIKAQVEIAGRPRRSASTWSRIGQHHNPPFVASSPTTTLAYDRRADRADHPVHRHHADHDHRPGAHRGGLRHAAAPHRRPGRPDDGPGQHRPGLPVVRQGHPRGHQPRDRELRAAAPPVARGRRGLGGPLPHAAAGLHRHPAAARRRAPVRVARLDPQPRDRRAGGVLRRRVLPQPHLLAGLRTPRRWSRSTARRFEHYGHGRADQAIVGLGGQFFMRRNSQDAVRTSSGPTSTTRRSTATARRWRTSPRRRR